MGSSALPDFARSPAAFFAKIVPDFSGFCQGDFANSLRQLAKWVGKIRKNPAIATARKWQTDLAKSGKSRKDPANPDAASSRLPCVRGKVAK